ncbi:tyrosine-type recombinase/integrase [Aquimarina macrocephali]|uniref:tyrosine-type recombinase/integrase n=1 Tax=Aquimarina macrocephali TaxID=666563 RepID=UPI003F6738C1
MKKTIDLIPLFKQFIRDSETGKRLKKNGNRITAGTIDNYRYVLHNLIEFSSSCDFDLRVCDAQKLTKREFESEKNYWKKFYRKFSDFMYKKGCYDNYVGSNMKQIRTFFNYLKNEKHFNTGDFHKLLYVRKEEIDILVISPEQLKFLIHNKEFETILTPPEKRIKDIFVFGCTTGLRFSDIFLLTTKNFEIQNGDWYLKVKSKKTKAYSSIKLPGYAVKIYQKYKSKSAKITLFTPIALYTFNKTLKSIGEKANFTAPIELSRERQGKTYTVYKNTQKKPERFCDKMSSHMMRRTAITTLLILGMPEHLVRTISGHSANSNSFYRYVHFAQSYVDKEIEKIHNKLETYE